MLKHATTSYARPLALIIMKLRITFIVLGIIWGIVGMTILNKYKERKKEEVWGSIYSNSYKGLEGTWEVTHAELIRNQATVKFDNFEEKQYIDLLERYEYRFLPNNKFEKGQPETFKENIEEMHGSYKIDTSARQIIWFNEWTNGTTSNSSWDYLELNPYKIIFYREVELGKELIILNRKIN